MKHLNTSLVLAAAFALSAIAPSFAGGFAESYPVNKTADAQVTMSQLQTNVHTPKGWMRPSRRSTMSTSGWHTGIAQSGFAPLPAAFYLFNNQWQNVVGGAHVNVYAGHFTQSPKDGVIVVLATSIDGQVTTAPRVFRTPAGAGSARIISARGTTLTIKTSTGLVTTFQVPSGGELIRTVPVMTHNR